MAQDGDEAQGEPSQQQVLDALIQRVGQHDDTAFARFYDLTVKRVYTLACKILRDPKAAEDVVADVYFQAWRRSAGHYDMARGHALAWLMTICRSRALDSLRRRDLAELHPVPEQLRPDLYRHDDNPLDLLLALERDSGVRAALTVLSEQERGMVSLAFFQGLSHQEIATQTGAPLGSVKTVLRRAMLILRDRLEPAVAGPPEQLPQQPILEIPPPHHIP